MSTGLTLRLPIRTSPWHVGVRLDAHRFSRMNEQLCTAHRGERMRKGWIRMAKTRRRFSVFLFFVSSISARPPPASTNADRICASPNPPFPSIACGIILWRVLHNRTSTGKGSSALFELEFAKRLQKKNKKKQKNKREEAAAADTETGAALVKPIAVAHACTRRPGTWLHLCA